MRLEIIAGGLSPVKHLFPANPVLGGGPRDLARVGARLRHLARGNEILAVDHQPTSAAIRKLATEAQRCGYVDSETAQAIVTVAGVSQKGRRLGRWLAWEEARTLLQAPNPHSIRGMRDRALLAVLVTCALRRGELSRLNCEHLAMSRRALGVSGFPGEGK